MSGNSIGTLFKVTTFGESHGKAMGVVVDGCPSGIHISSNHIQQFLDKRKPGFNPHTSPRMEPDKVEILSGIYNDITLGTPIAMVIHNINQNSKDYHHLANVYRPSHADFTWEHKFAHTDKRGGSRASARETVSRVAAGAIADCILTQYNIQIIGFLHSIGHLSISSSAENIDSNLINNNHFFCPDIDMIPKWEKLLKDIKQQGDSIGSIVGICIKNTPLGLGSPVFNKLTADLGKALFSIPAVKGVEFGDGFAIASKKGSEVNDTISMKNDKITYNTNHSGGLLGGISNGENINIRVAIKPTSSIAIKQNTITKNKKNTKITIEGRHDPCIGIRAVPVCQAMCSIILVDHLLHRLSELSLQKFDY